MKKCKQGYYYCYKDKKCKRIPTGYRVGLGGYLRREHGDEKEDSENKNGNHSNGNGNGNGNSNGSSNGGGGGGVSEEWSDKYKKSIDCNNPKGFSQKAHCRGRKKVNEDKQIKKIVQQLRKSVKSHAKQADTLEKKMTEGTLHKWFKGSKSKDGKGGWVNVVTGGTCASDEPGEGTPKCVSSAKRASMTKAERLSAARRKKKADPGQQQKSGAAKPTYVATDKPKKKMKKEETNMLEATYPSDFRNPDGSTRPVAKKKTGMPKAQVPPKKELDEAKDKKGKGSGTKDACYHKVKSRYSVWPSAYASGALVKCRKVGAANWGNKSEEMDYTSFAAKAKETIKKNKEKTLKGETKTKKEEWIVDNAAQYFFNEGINEEGLAIFIEELGVENFVEFVHDLAEDSELIEAYALTGKKKSPKRLPKGTQPAKTTKATIARGDSKIKAASPTGAFKRRPAAEKAVETAKKQQPKKRPVLDGIARQVLKGMDRHKKAMARAKQDIETTKKIASKIGKGAKEFGKGVKSGVETAGKVAKVAKKAVSENVQYSNWRDEFEAMEYEFIDLIKPEPLVTKDQVFENISPEPKLKSGSGLGGGKSVHPKGQEPKPTGAKLPKIKKVEEEVETVDEGQKCWKGYEKKGTKKMFGKTYNNCVKKEETEIEEKKDPCWDTHKQVGMKKKGGKMVPNCVPKEESDWRSEIEEGAAWTKKSGKNPSGGLNEKGRKSYERENPGSDLKRPSKKKGNKRRASFCARMKGMKKKLTSSKTANDPDSRINKSLRAWNC